MASVIHSIRNFAEDAHVLIKFIILFVPLLLIFFLGDKVIENHSVLFYSIMYYYFGYMIISMNKALNSNEVYLPNPLITIFDVAFRGIVGLLSTLPILIGAFFLVLWIEGLDTEPILKYSFITAGLIVCISIMMLQLTLYSKKYSFLDAFNLKLLHEAGGEFILQVFKLIFQLAFIVLLPAYITDLGVSQAFGNTTQYYAIFQIAFYAFIVMTIYLIVPQHFVQMYEELIITKEDEEYMKL